MIGIALLVVCGAVGVGIAFYLAKRQDGKKKRIAQTLASYSDRWSSDFLDPKFGTRGFLKRSVSFGDMHVDCTPDGLLINDAGAYHFLYHQANSPIAKIANKTYQLNFVAVYSNYFWIQGDGGKFQLRGALYKGRELRDLALKWGWEIFDGIPEGAELPKNFKGKKAAAQES